MRPAAGSKPAEPEVSQDWLRQSPMKNPNKPSLTINQIGAPASLTNSIGSACSFSNQVIIIPLLSRCLSKDYRQSKPARIPQKAQPEQHSQFWESFFWMTPGSESSGNLTGQEAGQDFFILQNSSISVIRISCLGAGWQLPQLDSLHTFKSLLHFCPSEAKVPTISAASNCSR